MAWRMLGLQEVARMFAVDTNRVNLKPALHEYTAIIQQTYPRPLPPQHQPRRPSTGKAM